MEFLLLFFLVTAIFLDDSSQKSSKNPGTPESDQSGLKAFDEILARYRSQIIHHIQARLGRDNDDWQDVFQSTAVSIFQALQKKQFDASKGPLSSFIYGITKNKISDYFNAKRRLRECGLPQEEELRQLIDNYSAEFAMVQDEAHLILKNCLKKLPERYRSVLKLRYFDELSMREIGRRLKHSEQQIIDLHRYGLKKLRDCFFQKRQD
jgi:RNA polymerase sigma-70 factor (ECF subfamily)